jgi:hypothetical protein
MTYVRPAAVSGSTSANTLETGTQKMSGGEGHVNDLLGSEGCKKMLPEFHCHSYVKHTQATPCCHIRKLQILLCPPLNTLHLASVLYVWY